MLCVDTNAPYNKQFESFMKQNSLRCKISWVQPEDHVNFENQKFLLLIAVKTRIPEDVEASLNYYNLQGKKIIAHIYALRLLVIGKNHLNK